MSIVCKQFISTATQSPDGSLSYQLGAVCRGEINKDWAAATPSGQLKHGAEPVLDAVWAARLSDSTSSLEVYVHVQPDQNGDWIFESCAFSYGGCSVKFRQKSQSWGTLELTINASAATKQMRESFAAALIAGEPARYCLIIRESE